jgi:hypothetical protein
MTASEWHRHDPGNVIGVGHRDKNWLMLQQDELDCVLDTESI